MLVFIDTEYTDPVTKHLISIGLVGEDGQQEFYAELPVQADDCNRFVREQVLPVLTGPVMTPAELKLALQAWFTEMPRRVVLAADSAIDIRLLMDLLGGRPPNVTQEWFDLRPLIDTTAYHTAVCRYHSQPDQPWHHALHDARAHRIGWLRGVSTPRSRI